MLVDEFDFVLPDERIALAPAEPRDAARLLHISRDRFEDRNIRDFCDMLRPGDRLVLNDTKVIPAQLTGTRGSRAGGDPVQIEFTLHKDMSDTDNNDAPARWRAFARPAKRVAVGDEIAFGQGITASVIDRDGAEVELLFSLAQFEFFDALAEIGAPPLPPYIARKRAVTAADEARYQTVFAKHQGSVAAPTAGLHFTNSMLDKLTERGVDIIHLTLHVGAGTFLPVSVDNTQDHIMHAEWGSVSQAAADAINETRDRGGRIIAVGTTSLRLLESASEDEGIVRPFAQETDIFITPGYQFKVVDGLLTNFHLPRSTLFMLVCAFAGVKRMKAAYAHAIESEYRFYSYGDACFLERDDKAKS